MQCELIYHMGLQLSEFENTDISELRWIHGWLIKQKQDEAKVVEDSIRGIGK